MTRRSDLTAVVLAGGLGTRLREITQNRYPKPMVPIRLGDEDVPFLEFVLAPLKQQGIGRFLLCIGHLGHAVKAHFGDGSDFGIHVRYDDAGDADTGARVHSAMSHLDDPCVFVACGDVYHPIEVSRFLQGLQDRPGWQVQLAATEQPGSGAPNMILAPDGHVIAHGEPGSVKGRAVLETGTMAIRRTALEGQSIGQDYSLTGHLFPTLARQGTLGGMVQPVPFFDIGTPERYRRFCAYAGAGHARPLSGIKP